MPIKIKELPESERPYEKLQMYGASTLSNSELIAIIIKTGTQKETSITLAQKILNLKKDTQKDLKFLQDVSIEEFMQIKGIGKVKAIQLKAVCELAKRMSRPINKQRRKIKNTKQIAELLIEELKYEKREIVKLVILNIKNEILKIIDISLGGTNFSIIDPKDVLSEPVKMNAPKIILVHNHPSGQIKPSAGDYLVTERIEQAADIMGIKLLDHIIVADNKFYSIILNKKEGKDINGNI